MFVDIYLCVCVKLLLFIYVCWFFLERKGERGRERKNKTKHGSGVFCTCPTRDWTCTLGMSSDQESNPQSLEMMLQPTDPLCQGQSLLVRQLSRLQFFTLTKWAARNTLLICSCILVGVLLWERFLEAKLLSWSQILSVLWLLTSTSTWGTHVYGLWP